MAKNEKEKGKINKDQSPKTGDKLPSPNKIIHTALLSKDRGSLKRVPENQPNGNHQAKPLHYAPPTRHRPNDPRPEKLFLSVIHPKGPLEHLDSTVPLGEGQHLPGLKIYLFEPIVGLVLLDPFIANFVALEGVDELLVIEGLVDIVGKRQKKLDSPADAVKVEQGMG